MDYAFIESSEDGLRKRCKIELDAQETTEMIDEIYAFYAAQAGIDCIADQAGSQTQDKLSGDLGERIAVCMANQCVDGIIANEGLPAAMEPVIGEMSELREGAPFSCEATICLKPTPQLTSCDPVRLSMPEFFVSDEMLARNIDAIVEERSRYVDDEDAVVVSDQTTEVITLHTAKSGMEVQALTFDSIVYRTGDGMLPPQIDERLIGMSPGEEERFSFVITSKNFLGLDVDETMDADLRVERIVKKEIPVVDDAWVKENIPGAYDVASFHEMVRANVTMRARADYDKIKGEAAVNALASRLPELQVPEGYYDYARSGLLQNVTAALSRQGMSLEELYAAQGVTEAQFLAQMSHRAQDVVRQGLALDAFALARGVEVDEDDLNLAAAAISPQGRAEARKMLEMNGRSYQLREMAMRSKARGLVMDEAIVQSA